MTDIVVTPKRDPAISNPAPEPGPQDLLVNHSGVARVSVAPADSRDADRRARFREDAHLHP